MKINSKRGKREVVWWCWHTLVALLDIWLFPFNFNLFRFIALITFQIAILWYNWNFFCIICKTFNLIFNNWLNGKHVALCYIFMIFNWLFSLLNDVIASFLEELDVFSFGPNYQLLFFVKG